MPDVASETFEDPLRSRAKPEVPLEPHLFVAVEGERPAAGGARVSLDQCAEVRLARGGARDVSRTVEGRTRCLTLALPDRRLSSLHARITWTGEEWLFEDTGSRNGSLVNGHPAKKVALADGDVVQVGHTTLLLATRLPTPHGTPDALDAADLAKSPLGMRTLLPQLAAELAQLAKVARSGIALLVHGETGTGKELLASAVRALSRPSGPFVAVNCGAIPDDLVESQLFGHVRGAFSGAVKDETGFVRAADGGTLFLDEIGDLPLAAQPALLRVLQEGEVVPVGATQPRKVDVRVVAATHRPLADLVASGSFRDDLLARLGGYTFTLPPLRARRGDLGALLPDLLAACSPIGAIEPGAALAMLRYRWPQNVRELARVLSLASVLADGGAVRIDHLPPALVAAAENDAPEPEGDEELPAGDVRAELVAQLEKHGGNVTDVARAMGKGRAQVYRWLKALKIDPKLYRA